MHTRVIRISHFASIAIAALVLAGCAQLSPQQVAFTPSIPADDVITGSGTMSLDVFDERSSKVIGHRGGVYKDTSTIVSKYDLEDSIRQLTEQVISKAGIELSTTFPDMTTTISLLELSYVSEDLKPSIKRTTVAANIKVAVLKGNVTFENSYKTSQYADTVGYPTEKKNSEMLNSVLDSVLQRLFSDAELEQFINN